MVRSFPYPLAGGWVRPEADPRALSLLQKLLYLRKAEGAGQRVSLEATTFEEFKRVPRLPQIALSPPLVPLSTLLA